MFVEFDNIVWGFFLVFCTVYKNIELAKVVVEKLFYIDLDNSGVFLVFVNVYVVCGKWVEVVKVRKLMKEKGVKKD